MKQISPSRPRVPARRGGAARIGSAICVGIWIAASACAPSPRGLASHLLEPPAAEESYCAWFGDAEGDVLYFGAAAFWPAFRGAGGDPRADLAQPGPQWIGRFDLRGERFLAPVRLGPAASAGGVWDVLARGGRVWFTDFFGTSGWVDLPSGLVVRLAALGPGLNEIAPGPDGDVLITRYGEGPLGVGSVLRVDAEGSLVAEHPLLGVEGAFVAAKSVAFDPVRREIWVNTDLLPSDDGAGAGGAEGDAGIAHDVRVLGEDGSERLRFALPEVQFMAFGEDGTGFFAERDGRLLSLRVRSADRAGSALLTGLRVPLDGDFPAGSDFVQDIQPLPDGGALVTRWSGRVHRVAADGSATHLALPREGDDLYYTGVARRGRVCVTRCGGVAVVCTDAATSGPAG